LAFPFYFGKIKYGSAGSRSGSTMLSKVIEGISRDLWYYKSLSPEEFSEALGMPGKNSKLFQ